LAAAEETRRRIVRATVELHGQYGAVGTTHEMIARQAGVSLPTVYKYFPTRNDLIPHCTGLVQSESPVQLDETVFHGMKDVPSRLRALTRRVFELYDYAAPWLRWSARDSVELPALQRVLEAAAEARTGLLRVAAVPEGVHTPPRRFMALGVLLLDFTSWQSLADKGYSCRAASEMVGDALVSLYAAARKEKES